MARSIFVRCSCGGLDFSYANLEGSTFHSANLSNINFAFANLQNVDFTNFIVTDSQLQSALSIRNAKLPNGTLGQGRNLIKNGRPDCHKPLVDDWQTENGNIIVMSSNKNPSQCQFTLLSITTGAAMSQRIPLLGI